MEVPSPYNVIYEGNHNSGITTKIYQPLYDESAGKSVELNFISDNNGSDALLSYLSNIFVALGGIFLILFHRRRIRTLFE